MIQRLCRPFFVMFFTASALSFLTGGSNTETAADSKMRPNILIVLADDLGYGDLACYGHPRIKTPHIDRFAREGLRLTSCYSAAANCSPARAGLMTGRTPSRVGIHNWIPLLSPMHVRKREITIATLLRQAGYATCHVGKWHLNGRFNLPGQPQPPDHGFDYWFSTQNNALPTHHSPENFVRNGKLVSVHRRFEGRDIQPPQHPANGGKPEEYAGHLVVDEAVHWLANERDRDKPFFLYVCFHEPHEPIASAKPYTELYDAPKGSMLPAHHGNVTQLDAAFGRLMKTLDQNDLRKNTLVLFTSDNGPAITRRHPHGSSGPLRDKKGSVYEGGIRVPGIIRWPGNTKAGSVTDEPISGVDLLPTLCAVTGLAVPDDRILDGASWLPILEGKQLFRKTPLYWHFNSATGGPKVAMRRGDWKILATLTGPDLKPYSDIRAGDQKLIKTVELNKFELYNIKKDIGETTDLSSQEPERLKDMATALNKMYHEVREESPIWPAWTSPRLEGKRIREFYEAEKAFTEKKAKTQ